MPEAKIQAIINDLAKSSQLDLNKTFESATGLRQLDYCQGYQAAIEGLIKGLNEAGFKINTPQLSVFNLDPIKITQTLDLIKIIEAKIKKIRRLHSQTVSLSASQTDYDLEFTNGRIEGLGEALNVLEGISATSSTANDSGRKKSTRLTHVH